MTEIKYIDGFYRFWDALLERFPKLMIDNCASGGNRMDLEAYTRSVFCWRSDTGCFPESEEKRISVWNQNQNLTLSAYVVYHAACTWTAVAYDVRSAVSNGFAANFDVFDEKCDFGKIKRILSECSHIRKYWEEDFYPLSKADNNENHWSACQFGGEESGVLLLFRRELDEHPQQRIALRGLNTEKRYLLKLSDEDYSVTEMTVDGLALSAGLDFTLAQPRTSLAVEYTML